MRECFASICKRHVPDRAKLGFSRWQMRVAAYFKHRITSDLIDDLTRVDKTDDERDLNLRRTRLNVRSLGPQHRFSLSDCVGAFSTGEFLRMMRFSERGTTQSPDPLSHFPSDLDLSQ